ncbi:MAG: hypothetical protein AB8B78_03655 [Polaribacter sp.]
MTLLATTYRTLSGKKEIIEIPNKKDSEWVIYQDGKPKYYTDFFDLQIESNAMMNSLVLCTKRSLDEVLELINKRNNINLSVPKISRLGYKKKIKSVETKINLEPIPEKWLAYSL